MVAYHRINDGSKGGGGPLIEELKLRIVQRKARHADNPLALKAIILKLPESEKFCTRDVHLDGAEIVGSKLQKPDVPIGAKEDTHRSDTLNISHPKIGRVTRARSQTLITIKEKDEVEKRLVEPIASVATNIRHKTAIFETELNEKLWQINCLKEFSSKAYWAIMARSKKFWKSRIVQNEKATLASTYTKI